MGEVGEVNLESESKVNPVIQAPPPGSTAELI